VGRSGFVRSSSPKKKKKSGDDYNSRLPIRKKVRVKASFGAGKTKEAQDKAED